VLGFTLNSYQTLNSAMVMEAARPEYYGRVTNIMMLTFSSMSVMAAPLGVVADAVGAGTLFVIQGGLIVVSMLLLSLLGPGYIFGRVGGGAGRGAAMRRSIAPREGAGMVPAAGDCAREPSPRRRVAGAAATCGGEARRLLHRPTTRRARPRPICPTMPPSAGRPSATTPPAIRLPVLHARPS